MRGVPVRVGSRAGDGPVTCRGFAAHASKRLETTPRPPDLRAVKPSLRGSAWWTWPR